MKEMLLGLVYMIIALFFTVLFVGSLNSDFYIIFKSPAVIALIFIGILMIGGLQTFIKGYKQKDK